MAADRGAAPSPRRRPATPPTAAPRRTAPRTSRRRLPELLGRQPARRAVLRGVRLRLHHRQPAPPDRDRRRHRRRHRRRDRRRRPAGPDARGRRQPLARPQPGVGGRDLDRPRLVRRPGEHRRAALARPADRPAAGAPSVLVGRASRSRDITPDIDLSSDNGISRRHAQLTTDGTRWWVEDLGSSNGTYVGPAVGPLPTDPCPRARGRRSPPTIASTSVPGPASSSARPPPARAERRFRDPRSTGDP